MLDLEQLIHNEIQSMCDAGNVEMISKTNGGSNVSSIIAHCRQEFPMYFGGQAILLPYRVQPPQQPLLRMAFFKVAGGKTKNVTDSVTYERLLYLSVQLSVV